MYTKIMNMDIMEGLKNISNNSIECIFIDPPYNLGKKYKETTDYWEEEEYLQWCYEWLELALKKLKKMEVYILCVQHNIMPILIFF
ncbi:modification methylase HpaI [Fusobacterium animalis ATCC 51191]|uniref:Modification methylase HpaI n=1 Tax=Fusobacterium animalis ATCC 51191 TaxID=997347 RepID=F9EM97_9FUSO|nr:modification methylase HpaI [Fusobacterium animalis ATCC 51191]